MSEHDKRGAMRRVRGATAGPLSRRGSLRAIGFAGVVAVMLVLLAGALSGCSDDGTTTTSAAGASTTDAADATTTSAAAGQGEKVVIAVEDFGRDIPFSWLNGPRDARPWLQVWDPLIQVSNEAPSDWQPGLFTEWTHSDDYTTWTFKLREGVMFHDDNGELTAADVKWSLEQHLRQDAQGFGNPAFQQMIASIDAPDPYTVVVNCKTNNWNLPGYLSPLGLGPTITSQAYMEKVGEQEAMKHPIGTGPYRFLSGTQGSTYLFESVPDQWRVSGGFKQIEYQAVPDEATRVAGLQSGQFDVVQASGDSLTQVESAGFGVVEFPGVSQYWVMLPGQLTPAFPGYNPDYPWVGQPDEAGQEKAAKVREALNLAVNKQAIIDAFWQGHGAQTPYSYFIYPNTPGSSDTWVVPPYDPEQAKTLLAEAGYPDGFEIPALMVNQAVDGPQLMEAVAQDWEKIGLKVSRANAGMMDLIPQIQTGNVTQAWVFSSVNVIDNAAFAWPDNLGVGSPTALFVRNDALEAQMIAARDELDEAKRLEMTTAIAQGMYDDYLGVMIGIKGVTYAVNDKVSAWDPPAPTMYYPYPEYLQWSGK